MNNSEKILAVLLKHCADQCEIVGDATVKDVVRGVVANTPADDMIRQAPGGADFNSVETVRYLIDTAIIVRVCLDVWELTGGVPSTEQLTELLKTRKVRVGALALSGAAAISKVVLDIVTS